jgi:hypothetical protein
MNQRGEKRHLARAEHRSPYWGQLRKFYKSDLTISKHRKSLARTLLGHKTRSAPPSLFKIVPKAQFVLQMCIILIKHNLNITEKRRILRMH